MSEREQAQELAELSRLIADPNVSMAAIGLRMRNQAELYKRIQASLDRLDARYAAGYREAIETARKAQCSACKDGWVLNEQGYHVAPGAGSFTVPCHAQAIRALEPNAIEALTPGESE